MHDALRHRQLRKTCLDTGKTCDKSDKCCGKRECQLTFSDPMTIITHCCVPEGVKGCDSSEDCCAGKDSNGNDIQLTCTDSACGATEDTDTRVSSIFYVH